MIQNDYQEKLEQELERLVSFRSVTRNRQATKKLLVYVEDELRKIGLKTSLQEHNGFWSLVAGTKSLTKSEILLQGHIDVVPAPDSLFKIHKSGDLFRARGVYDMLFATASYLAILRSFADKGIVKKYDIGIMLTSDEEVGGHNGVSALFKDYSCGVCILPDAGRKDVLNTGSKGVLQLRVIAQGLSGHSARPNEYKNPIHGLARIINDLETTFNNKNSRETTCSITVVEGGAAYNQVPDVATLVLDVRYVSTDDPDVIQQKIADIAHNNSASVEMMVLEPAFSIDPKNAQIEKYKKIHKALTGRDMTHDMSNGSSDARFIVPQDVPVIMTRPDGGGLHAPTEWVSLSSLNEFTHVLEKFISDY